MRIVLASSEAVPYAKTGGLADVASALAKELARQGHDVWLVVPHYPQAVERQRLGEVTRKPSGVSVEVRLGSKRVAGNILNSTLPDSEARVLLVDQPAYFDRPGLYGQDGEDYKDNCERFVFFSRAVMQAAERLELRPDVLHVNDWQTGLIPALLAIEYRHTPGFERTGSVFTIHNLAFQGEFWHWDMELTGLDWKHFNWREMEHYDSLNLLKTGVVFADMITTVSPTYAREIQTEELGNNLHAVLAARGDDLVGIMNGVDTGVWNPATDGALARNYALPDDDDEDLTAMMEAKAACKADLQRHLGLPERPDALLLGMVSRLTDQKGLDLIAEDAEKVLALEVQMAFLGTGDPKYETMLERLAADHSEKVAARIDYDERLAHRIEGGADAFLMPSRFEPCGLNQMYSLIYGTVPIVRRVGGLADSVVDATPENLAAGEATGFCFDRDERGALVEQIERAVAAYRDRKTWRQLVRTGMRQDWSWRRSAAEYVEVYQRARARRSSG